MALHIVTYEYPKRIYRGSFEISDKHYQSFLKRIHWRIKTIWSYTGIQKHLTLLQMENYRAVRLLPHISKVFERVINKQINNLMENKIS